MSNPGDLRVGDYVELSDGRTGYLNKLRDLDGKPRRTIEAGTATVLLNSDVPLDQLTWDEIEVTVPVETVNKIRRTP